MMTHALCDLRRHLDAIRVPYRLERHRQDTVLVAITLVGERIEADVFGDGHIEVSRFRGDESVEGDAADLLAQLTYHRARE